MRIKRIKHVCKHVTPLKYKWNNVLHYVERKVLVSEKLTCLRLKKSALFHRLVEIIQGLKELID